MNPHPTPQDGGKQEHSPFPWRTEPREVVDHNGYPSGCIVHDLFATEQGAEFRIGEIWCHRYFGHSAFSENQSFSRARNAANAAFIVSSVNSIAGMREENKRLLAALRKIDNEIPDDPRLPLSLRIRDIARTAILDLQSPPQENKA